MIDPATVGVVEEDRVAIAVGPVVAEVDENAAMRMSAPKFKFVRRADSRADVVASEVVKVIGDGPDALVGELAGFTHRHGS